MEKSKSATSVLTMVKQLTKRKTFDQKNIENEQFGLKAKPKTFLFETFDKILQEEDCEAEENLQR